MTAVCGRAASLDSGGTEITSGNTDSAGPLIDLRSMAGHTAVGRILARLAAPLESLLAISTLNRLYMQMAEQEEPFFEAALRALSARYRVSDLDLQNIPKQGPLVVVANHPFGGVEGLILGAILLKVRPDVRILGNYLLTGIPRIREWVIPVDPFGRPESVAANVQGLKTAMRWVRSGGVLVTFPSGEVSHFQLRMGAIADSAWSPHVGRIIRRSGAGVVPVFFPGRNSLLFQAAGMVHPRLRTLLLIREMINKRNSTFPLHIGRPVPAGKIRTLAGDAAVMAHLREKVYLLQHRRPVPQERFFSFGFHRLETTRRVPVAGPVYPALIRQEIASLPPSQALISKGCLGVYWATASQIPNTLREIGRLREVTFREAGEGSGNALDLDRFDHSYVHLFLWHHERTELVGAYRLGLTDEILKREGPAGLYTGTLFHFRPGFLRELGPAIELGRSFIRSRYQKKYSSLLLLWQGIGQFILQRSRYTTLFGPVSISRNYHVLSRSLMVQFLTEKRLEPRLARYVSPRKPYRVHRRVRHAGRNLMPDPDMSAEDISLLVSEIEQDGKGLPILLQHYLKLNARIMGFNLDEQFSHVVDGLILVDLKQTEPRLIRRFMGEEGLRLLFGDAESDAEVCRFGDDPAALGEVRNG